MRISIIRRNRERQLCVSCKSIRCLLQCIANRAGRQPQGENEADTLPHGPQGPQPVYTAVAKAQLAQTGPSVPDSFLMTLAPAPYLNSEAAALSVDTRHWRTSKGVEYLVVRLRW